jgi:hypothetical protein
MTTLSMRNGKSACVWDASDGRNRIDPVKLRSQNGRSRGVRRAAQPIVARRQNDDSALSSYLCGCQAELALDQHRPNRSMKRGDFPTVLCC